MTDQKDKIYQFAPLSGYTLKQRILIRIADLAFFLSIKILGTLTRFEVRGAGHLAAIEKAGRFPIFTYWHDRVFLGTYFWRNRGIIAMTSKSFDGEYTARVSQRFGFGAIRGSSTRGGSRALIGMIRSMRAGSAMAFATDGPKGPRYKAKLGPVILAKKTGNPILPFIIEPQKYWTINSWDKMQIPMPFSRALTIIGEPIYVAGNADGVEVELKLQLVQRSLDDLTRQGREWREQND